MKWISIKKKKPKKPGDYLTFNSSRYHEIEVTHWCDGWPFENSMHAITHWARLPKFPKPYTTIRNKE
jgi:hypothetical protein